MPKILTTDQIQQFRENGYVTPFRVLDDDQVEVFQEKFLQFVDRLEAKGLTTNDVDGWHTVNSFLWKLCRVPKILDCFEDLLGPNLMLWAANFFAKQPGDETTVPWHQDIGYWPISPREHTVSGWLAVFDADVGNGCMRFMPGTHKTLLEHKGQTRSTDVLNLAIAEADFDPSQAVNIELKAGEMSLHTDAIMHSSPANLSNRIRCGMTIRVASPDVQADPKVWPSFKWALLRGVDEHKRHAYVQPPTEENIPSGRMRFDRQKISRRILSACKTFLFKT